MSEFDEGLEKGSRAALLSRMIEEGGISERLYAKDAVTHKAWSVAARPDAKGEPPEALSERDGAFDLSRLFSDIKVSVEDAFECDNRVVLRWRMRGVPAAEVSFPWAPDEATGRPAEFSGINIYRFERNRIVESWGEVDLAALESSSCREALTLAARR